MSRISLILLLVFYVPVVGKLFLKTDLQRDRVMLNEHGTYMDKAGKDKFKAFNKYANLDVSKFKFSKREVGKHIISKWNGGKGQPCIYQVETTLHVDTVFGLTLITTGPVNQKLADSVVDKITVKEDFKFRTYIIDAPNQKRLIYMSQQGVGLVFFSIGKKRYSPVHEDLMYGVIYPDMKEIKDLIKIK